MFFPSWEKNLFMWNNWVKVWMFWNPWYIHIAKFLSMYTNLLSYWQWYDLWLTYAFYCVLANSYLAMDICDWSGLYLPFVILWFCFSDKGKERSCAENLCEQNCTQLSEGGFICSCRPGFKASISDRNSCDGRIYFLPIPIRRTLSFFCSSLIPYY